jgi:ParB family chromosome partitioning protein
MNKPEQKQVHFSHIDFDDQSYIFTFEPLLSPLINSIKKIGLINPPILEQTSDNSYRIVTGLKRILALGQLKINQFPAKVYQSMNPVPALDLFLINFYENIGTRKLNEIEKSIILHKFIHLFQVSEESVISEFLPLLNPGANKTVLDRYLKLVYLEDTVRIAIVENFISIDNALALFEISRIERQSIFDLFQRLQLGKNNQKELVRLLDEIAKISNRSMVQIVEDDAIQDILSNEKITSPRKIEHIKEVLKKMRYPQFSRVERNFQNLKKDLKLPPNIILRPPTFFEGEKYTIEFSFKNQAEFNKLTGILASIAEQDKLAELETLA